MSSATANAPTEPRAYHLPEEPHLHEGHSTMLGFWMYLMSDCLIFAILFATYAVLGGSYAGGPGPKDLFDLNLIALNTAMLLFSSITYGFAMLAMEKNRISATQGWLFVTLLFGGAFLFIELYEFSHLKGAANVFIFPNLESSNIAFKMMQCLGEAEVVGPVLLGLKKPVHILQRESDVNSIVNLTALTAFQVEEERGES